MVVYVSPKDPGLFSMTPVLSGTFDKFFAGLKNLERFDNEPELVKKIKPSDRRESVKACVSGKDTTASLKALVEKRATRATIKNYEYLPEPDQSKILKETNFMCVFNTYKQ